MRFLQNLQRFVYLRNSFINIYKFISTLFQTSAHTYQYQLPFQFTPFQQYKISIFAVDDSFCHNQDVFHIFNTTNATFSSSEIPKTTPIPEISGSAITKTTMLMVSFLQLKKLKKFEQSVFRSHQFW